MNAHDAITRRIGFWFAMLTGIVLVGMQFSCLGPQTILAAPGFPRASRRIDPQVEAMATSTPLEDQSKEVRASMYWTSPKPVTKPVTQVAYTKVPPALSRTARGDE